MIPNIDSWEKVLNNKKDFFIKLFWGQHLSNDNNIHLSNNKKTIFLI